MMHATQNSEQDFLFPNVVIKKGVVTLCPVAYNYFLKKLKMEATLAHLSCDELKEKLGLHSLRRGPVTKAINAGTSDVIVINQ